SRINRHIATIEGISPMLAEPYKPVLLNMPITLLERLDNAASALQMNRSDLIRRSLARDLEFLVSNEVALARARENTSQRLYRIWAHGNKEPLHGAYT